MSFLNQVLGERSVKILLIFIVALGILPLGLKGLKYGMDFTGGTLISVKLDAKLEQQDLQTVINILQTRLNAFGLKEVTIKPFGQEYIIVEIAETDANAINQLQALLGQQGKFETLFKGKQILNGSDIVSVVTNPQSGYGITPTANGFEWQVPFILSGSGAQKFAREIEGQCTPIAGSQSCQEVVYMFIDRPTNPAIVMTSAERESEKQVPDDFATSQTLIDLEEVMQNSNAVLVIADSVTPEVLNATAGKNVIFKQDSFNASLFTTAAKVTEKPQKKKYWIQDALNLENIIHLTPGVTQGNAITQPTITGRASTQLEASQELNKVTILLKSGRLPVSVAVGSVSTISPSLGPEFLKYSALAGLAAISAVSAVVFIRYRKIKITLPLLLTSFTEVFLILGMAALIG